MFTVPRLPFQIGFLIAAVLIVYQFAPQGQFIPIDDALLSHGNPIVQQFDIRGAFTTFDPELYIPLTLLSYQIEYAFGATASQYHMTNVFLHLINSILVLFLVRFWTRRWEIPFCTALLFAVHPINTEAVMWIAARKDLLPTTFLLGSLIAYCHQRKTQVRWSFYLSIVLFICALLCKVSAVVLPLLLIILDDFISAKKQPYERLRKWCYYIPALTILGVGMLRKMISVYTISIVDAALISMKGLFFYLQKLLIPTGLSVFYKQEYPLTWFSLEFLTPIAGLALLGLITIESRKYSKTFSFGMLWFLIAVLPNVGNVSKGDASLLFFASDRYVYIAGIGIFFLLGTGFLWMTDHAQSIVRKRGILLAACAILLLYGFQTQRYSIEWLTSETFMTHTKAFYPRTPYIYTIEGVEALAEDDLPKAERSLRTAAGFSEQYAVAASLLGVTLARQGRLEAAQIYLYSAMKEWPSFALTYAYMAYVELKKGNEASAEGYLIQALENEPREHHALQLMGTLRALQHRNKDAETYYRKAIAADPNAIYSKAALVQLLQK